MNTFVAVEALQACHRACAIAKFTEIVVFQNPCIVPCGNAEKIKTSSQRHRVAVLLQSVLRFFKFLPGEERKAFLHQVAEKAS